MEREIKFRGKSIESGKWIYGNLLDNGLSLKKKFFILPSEADNFDEYEEVHSESVGEFIGKKDKKGVDIYEGDITRDKYVIKWHKEKALFAEHFYSTFQKTWNLSSYPISTKEIEIVSNIHDKL